MYPLLQIQQQQKNLKNWGQKSFLGNSFYRISVHSECWKFKEVSNLLYIPTFNPRIISKYL